jgi:hypothetical protein
MEHDRFSVPWRNTRDKEFPYHGQFVVIDVDDNFNIAVYNSQTYSFVLTSEPYTSYPASNNNVKWTDFKL